jgi:hypothetical protein
MRSFLIALLAIAGVAVINPVRAVAAPANGVPIADLLDANSLVQDARLVCVNRYTGRILYYGPCGGHRWHRHHRHYWHYYWRPRYHHWRWRHHRHWRHRYFYFY